MINMQAIIIIFIVAIVTAIIRFLPFVVFKNNVPNFIEYLGKKLPYAIMAMLVVYCLKDTNTQSFNTILPTIIGVSGVVIMHIYKKNILLSIVLGTILYMLALNLL